MAYINLSVQTKRPIVSFSGRADELGLVRNVTNSFPHSVRNTACSTKTAHSAIVFRPIQPPHPRSLTRRGAESVTEADGPFLTPYVVGWQSCPTSTRSTTSLPWGGSKAVMLHLQRRYRLIVFSQSSRDCPGFGSVFAIVREGVSLGRSVP